MLPDLNRKLEESKRKIAEKEKLQEELAQLEGQRAGIEAQISALEVEMGKRKVDLNRFKWFGVEPGEQEMDESAKQQLVEKRGLYEKAKTRHNELIHQEHRLRSDIRRLKAHVWEFEPFERDWQSAIWLKKDHLSRSGGQTAAAIENTYNDILALRKEVLRDQEALKLGERVLDGLQDIHRRINLVAELQASERSEFVILRQIEAANRVKQAIKLDLAEFLDEYSRKEAALAGEKLASFKESLAYFLEATTEWIKGDEISRYTENLKSVVEQVNAVQVSLKARNEKQSTILKTRVKDWETLVEKSE